jgi:AraC family transcriptional regulator
MDVEDITEFCSGLIRIDIAKLFETIAAFDFTDASAIAALRPCPLAVAALNARRPSGITVARTFHGDKGFHSAELCCPALHYLVTIALTDARMSLANDACVVIAGPLRAGTTCVTSPSERLAIHSQGACDLIHLAIPAAILRRHATRQYDLDGLVLHDPLLGQIGYLLGESPAGWLRTYAELLSQIAVTRVLQLAPELSSRCLAAWRLKRVHTFVDANIDEPLRLNDLAAAAGLSRMYFAAQFRAATGMRPHDYVLARRIVRAKEMMALGEGSLVQIALDAGFQSQAHFCTVFRRFNSMTPSVWRRERSSTRHLQRDTHPVGPSTGRLYPAPPPFPAVYAGRFRSGACAA